MIIFKNIWIKGLNRLKRIKIKGGMRKTDGEKYQQKKNKLKMNRVICCRSRLLMLHKNRVTRGPRKIEDRDCES